MTINNPDKTLYFNKGTYDLNKNKSKQPIQENFILLATKTINQLHDFQR